MQNKVSWSMKQRAKATGSFDSSVDVFKTSYHMEPRKEGIGYIC